MRFQACAVVLALMAISMAWVASASGTIDLTDGWRFAPDPDDAGIEQGWEEPGFDDSGWDTIRGGVRWEDQGFPEVDGYAWYRRTVHVPERMRAERIWLNLGGLNDCGIVYCNGRKAGVFGDQSRISVAGSPLAADLTDCINWGAENLVAIRVFDWGDSGGLQKAPCALTTDRDTLAVQSLLCFAPGFDGRPSFIGLEVGPLGAGEGSAVRFSLAVEGQAPSVKETTAGLNHSGRPFGVARFDCGAEPGDTVQVAAELVGEKGAAGMRFEQTYTWPEPPRWPEEYGKLKVLNNFVTELRSVERVRGKVARYPFLNPREGWVFIQVIGDDEPRAHLDNNEDAVIWRVHPETGAFEAMQHLGKGEHELRVEEADGARLDIRAVPEIGFCYWPTYSKVKPLPERDTAFGEARVFPNVNTLFTHNKMDEAFYDSWRAEGRRWISNASLPGLHDDTAPTADAVYDKWAANPSVTRPGYSGMVVDEFLNNPPEKYAAWSEALDRFYEIPAFDGQAFYAWVGGTYAHEPGLAFMRQLYDLGGRFAWEKYLHEEPTEDMALMRAYYDLKGIEEWNALMPGVKERVTVCLGAFTMPTCSININPGINYLPFMDAQYHILATDPLFFGMLGAFEYSAHYMDDDVLRYSLRLYRHYCIDGKRTPYGDFPYALTHLRNPDFADGLVEWEVEAAEPGSVTAGGMRGLGLLQGRWASLATGDKCAVMVCNRKGPNKVSQTVTDLEPGRIYTMKYIVADLDDIYAEKKVELWPTLEGVEIIEDRGFREVMPSLFAAAYKDDFAVKLEGMAYTTYCQVTFRPKGATAELIFSDWKDGQPAGPIGHRVGFNFVEIQPFFEG